MKAVTIAKIARFIVIISVVIVLAIPTFSGLESMNVNGAEFITTDSVYQMDYMTAEDLSNNIKDVVGTTEGYTINYGSYVGKPVPTNDSERDTLAAEIKAAIPHGKATLVDPDGKVPKQQTIMGSGEGYKQYIFTGLKLTGSMVNQVTPSISLDSVINGVRNKISDVEITKNGDSFDIKIEIPYLLFASALAAGNEAKVGMSIGIEYNSFFSMNLKLDMPIKTFTGGTDIGIEYDVKKDTTYTNTEHPEYLGLNIKQELEIDASSFSGISEFSDISASIGNFGSSEGGVRLEVDDTGKIQIMADKENLVDALQSARNEDGSLTINIDGMDPITVDGEQVDSLLSMYGELINMVLEGGSP